jgi:hypothetical protein
MRVTKENPQSALNAGILDAKETRRGYGKSAGIERSGGLGLRDHAPIEGG